MTNREWLESLSDEFLSGLLSDCVADCPVCPVGPEYCADQKDLTECSKVILRWLQAEHEEDKNG